MTDLAVLALGFGGMPLAAIVLYNFREWIAGHRGIAWASLAGVMAFLGLSHAMALVLETKSFLFGGAGGVVPVLFLGTALGLGFALAWFVFEGPLTRAEPSKVVWAAVAFLALHSFGDGLVLGGGFARGVLPSVPIDSLTISATILHRFLEGAIVIVPALAASWRPRASFVALFVSLFAIPAAYAPTLFADSMGFVAGTATAMAVSAFLAAAEASLVVILLLRGFLPITTADRGTRWIVWTAIGFVGISVVHFLVE
jgi:hypothetical protein